MGAACGSLPDDPSEPDALATLEGELSNQGGISLEGNVRIAVIWRRINDHGEISFSVAEDVPVEPVFPSKFRVVLHNAPPEEAMIVANELFSEPDDDPQPGLPEPGDPGPAPVPEPAPAPAGLRPKAIGAQESGSLPPDLRVAVGSLVAYVDENGNGQLDLVEEGAPVFLDRVVATNKKLLLTYFEGTIPEEFPGLGAPPAPGYNFITNDCDDSTSSNGDDGNDSSGGVAKVKTTSMTCGGVATPPNEPFTLPVTDDPGLNDLMCTNGGSHEGEGSDSAGPLPDPSVQPASYPAPNAEGLYCSPDGTYYSLSTCETYSEGPCKGVVTTCHTEAYARPTPAPAAWPCPPG